MRREDTFHSMRPAVALVAALIAVMLAPPASAQAKPWKGWSADGRSSARVTDDFRVLTLRLALNAKCRRRGFRFRSGVRFNRVRNGPLRSLEPGPYPPVQRRFRDRGKFREKLRDGLRALISLRVAGRVTHDPANAHGDVASGVLRVRVRIFKGGRRIDTCRARGNRFEAYRDRSAG